MAATLPRAPARRQGGVKIVSPGVWTSSRSRPVTRHRSFTGEVTNVLTLPKRLLVGTPLRSEHMGHTPLPKLIALPVFCSDPLSSNAYATEEILLRLSRGGFASCNAPGGRPRL